MSPSLLIFYMKAVGLFSDVRFLHFLNTHFRCLLFYRRETAECKIKRKEGIKSLHQNVS